MKLLDWLTQELDAWDYDYPAWLETLVMDDLYYSIAVMLIMINSFSLGLFLGWLRTL